VRPLLLAVLLVLAIQPVAARPLATAYPAQFTLIAEPVPGGGEPLVGLIGQAQSRLLVECYAVNDPPIVAALAAARGRGVDVRVMADPHSASSGAALAQLAGRDVWVRRGNPAFALTGQCAAVIDQNTLAVSNAPLTQKARTTEQRFLAVDRDGMDVQQAASVFYDDWERRSPNRFGHQTVLAPPDYQTDAIAAINSASHTLEIMGETLTSQAIVQAVEGAALRQVKVRLLLEPGLPQGILAGLAAAGAETRLLSGGFTGSGIAIDGTHLLIGSAALDDVSLQQQRELGLLLNDRHVSAAFAAAFEADWAGATKVAVATPTSVPPTSTIAPITAFTPAPPTATPRGRRATPTLAPLPITPTPPLTATPSVLTLSPSYTSSVRIGGTQQIVVRTLPGAAVTITVTYPDGSTHNPGTTQGVGVADATGSFVDTWTIAPSVAPGIARALITVSAIGKTQHETITFTITL
jgi:phosphatidylserine/phosphatidylglycerophosphate/cardiolipin synthase-like enzyme